jgi:ubiquinone/menaquinone biosynthesis C-methylase UbiE
VSSLALMRWLEAAPDRYDSGMHLITLGRVDRLHAALSEAALAAGASILELGSGTGAVTARLVAGGARVTAIEQNPEMLELARSRLAGAPTDAVIWLERTASEVEAVSEAGFDAVVASLCLSEMSAGERAFVLRAARSRLRSGGALVVGDEVWPDRPWQRWLFGLLRLPQAMLGWLLAGSLSQPIAQLADEIRAAGFEVVFERRWLGGSLMLISARPKSDASGA